MTDYPPEARHSAEGSPQPEGSQEPGVLQAVTEAGSEGEPADVQAEPREFTREACPEREEAAGPEISARLSADSAPDPEDKLAALEAVLFMAADPLPSTELAEILEVTPALADQLASELSTVYSGRGIHVARVAGGYQIATRPEYGPFVAKLHQPERFRLSRAALETLAIVAYKQPITRPEIEAIRGVNCDSPVDTLTQYELICEAGRKEAPGRPLLYRTTDSFLGTFGLNSVADLPQLDSIPADEEALRAEVAGYAGAARSGGEVGEESSDAQPFGAEEGVGGEAALPADDAPQENQERPA